MKDGEQKDTDGDAETGDNVTKITEGKEAEPTQKLDLNAPPTHFALPAQAVRELAEHLEGEPWRVTVKQAMKLLRLLEGGTPLVLGPKT